MWHGCTHIAGLYPNRAAAHDFLLYGSNLVKGLGFSTLKLELSIAYNTIKYPGQTFGPVASLVDLARDPTSFDIVFSDPAISRYWLSVFSIVQPIDNLWGVQWTSAIGDAVEQEFYDLCVHLLSYTNKEFYLSNWEGDWQLLLAFNPDVPIKRSTLNAYRDFSRRRQRALTRARQNVASTSTIYYSIECNRVLDGWGPRVHSDVVSNVGPDIVGLSCYEAIEGWQRGLSQSQLEADIVTKLTTIVNRVRQYHSGPIAISEFGWPIYNPGFVSGGYDVAALLTVTIATAASLGIIGEIYWQILDNEQQAPGVPYGFGLYDRNGSSTTVGGLSPTGLFYQSFL